LDLNWQNMQLQLDLLTCNALLNSTSEIPSLSPELLFRMMLGHSTFNSAYIEHWPLRATVLDGLSVLRVTMTAMSKASFLFASDAAGRPISLDQAQNQKEIAFFHFDGVSNFTESTAHGILAQRPGHPGQPAHQLAADGHGYGPSQGNGDAMFSAYCSTSKKIIKSVRWAICWAHPSLQELLRGPRHSS
jgi:hypothetical protein